MVKSLVSKLSASNISLASTLSSVGVGHGSSNQETNYAKHRNDPGRFFGDGVQFKAKLIGILEVGEARGDRMCQEALQDLKMAIRAAGEHKQRITIHVTIDGLRLRDEKTGDSLYHHPVHKISFIAQDMTDSRAFGYIFGSPDSGHRFFGIKTDKAASQVVLAMRDLFQVVFELKKKEIELARQQIQSKSIHEHHMTSLSSLKSSGGGTHNDLNNGASTSGAGALSTLAGLGGSGNSNITRLGVNIDAKGSSKEMSPESVADLVDLEQELSSIQRGITQMERITPNDPSQPNVSTDSRDEDPFGDSFTHFPQAYNLLPPPESGRSRSKPISKANETLSSGGANVNATPSIPLTTLLSPAPVAGGSSSPGPAQTEEDDSWLNELDTQNDVFDTTKMSGGGGGVGGGGAATLGSSLPLAPLAASESTSTPTQQLSENSAVEDTCASGSATATSLQNDPEQSPASTKTDAFTDLDPLGTGRTRPYVDKKYFFQELKNPPKKVLKDLSATSLSSSTPLTTATLTGTTAGLVASQLAANTTHEMMTGAQYQTVAAVVDEFLSKEGLFDGAPPGTSASSSVDEAQQKLLQQQLKPKGHPNLSTTLTTNVDINGKNPTTDSIAGESLIPADAVMLPRDTDPFSPTRKKSDPFQEGDIFSKLDPFEFEFVASSSASASASASATGKTVESTQRFSPTTSRRTTPAEVFNGPLQVSLPPERGLSPSSTAGVHWKGDISRLERQSSLSPTVTGGGSSIRSRPTPSVAIGTSASISSSASAATSHAHATPSSVFKQQTADVISSISNKKMPHLFGQARFSKRGGGDSNSINMRRLQESDSLSETETAPEPPPRPESALHVEPPPLPPKKQFNDIVIRPRVISDNAISPPVPHQTSSTMSTSSNIQSTTGGSSMNRYEFVTTVPPSSAAPDAPPIPLPSRRISRSDGSYPGPGRPRKPGHAEDDYLTPLGAAPVATTAASSDLPPLLPPPTQTSTRMRAQRQQSLSHKSQEIYENKTEILQHEVSGDTTAILPDITLSQLLTLGIDELAVKLNVPTSKLSIMTLVELTTYLSDFLENAKPSTTTTSGAGRESVSPKLAKDFPESESGAGAGAVFKVDFNPQGTFVAKFDDTFGEDLPVRQAKDSEEESFVANFEKCNGPPVAPPILSKAGGATAVPSADRYAVFREIIDKELQIQKENVDLMGMSDVPTPSATQPTQQTNIESDELNMMDSKQSNVGGGGYEPKFEDENSDFLGPQSLLSQPVALKIDTKITEVVAQAKDRYAALRDIILVENLFDKKPPPQSPPENDDTQEFRAFSDEFAEDQDVKQIIMKSRIPPGGAVCLLDSRGLPAEPSSSVITVEDDDDEDEEDDDGDGAGESSLDSNEKESSTAHRGRQDQYEKLSTSTQHLDMDHSGSEKPKSSECVASIHSNLLANKQDTKFLTVANSSGLSTSKDDLEIDELMQRAISNLSLDSRERVSPAVSTSGASIPPGPRSTSATITSTQSPITASASALQQRSPVSLIAPTSYNSRHKRKSSPQVVSPVTLPAPLAVVSNLIDTATKQMSSSISIGSTGGGSELLGESEGTRMSSAHKESWATFDSPKANNYAETVGPEKRGKGAAKTTNLHLPPAPPSNASNNDTAESPCSSDPRDEGWNKGRRCWPKTKDRQQTSSSSRDLSPWDDDGTAEYHKQQQQQRRMMAAQSHGHAHAPHSDRHTYYMRHTRRMNSCDEDYDYEEEPSNRRDHRKFNKGLSRSRDNFELDSPSWYHHPPHHTWSPQDIEQAAVASRMRSFERSAYERNTYGPPIYDKRVGSGSGSSYDRRGGFDKRKYYRDYGPRPPNYDFEDYGESPSLQDRYGKIGRRSDYENVYDDGRSPMSAMYGGGVGGVGGGGGGSGGGSGRSRADYAYERDRKSFDRDSVESFESSTRRRRSFGSGDVYGSLEGSREEFRGRYMMGSGGEKSRSLRKSMKLRATGDIDYEQDSENDFHQRPRVVPGVGSGGPIESRSLQRPSQLVSGSGGPGISRIRKSSGSSPWDGEETPLPGPKSAWKRPGSATESERRLAESRRAAAIGQTPSGSDGEKDRRFRKKSRTRGKDYIQGSGIGAIPTTAAGPVGGSARQYGSNYDTVVGPSSAGGNYPHGDAIDDDNDDDDDDDYVDEEYDEPPTDEDKFERLNRRRLEMNQRMLDSERRQQGMQGKSSKGSFSIPTAKRYHHHCTGVGRSGNLASYEMDDYDEQTPTPRSNTSSAHPNSGSMAGSNTKFSFDGGGFESDFNQSSPPPAPAGTASSCTSTPAALSSAGASNKASFRFSNDFSDREKVQQLAPNSNVSSVSSLQQQFDLDASPGSHAATSSTTQKLRFDDNVKVSQFHDAAFEDDFSKAPFDFTKSEGDWQQAETTQSVPLQSALSGMLNNSTNNTAVVSTKKQHLRNSKLQQRQDLIKKSESINIFARKVEDPFEDDEFFKAPNNDATTKPTSTSGYGEHSNDKRCGGSGSGNGNGNGNGNGFQWEGESNFAKFDENM